MRPFVYLFNLIASSVLGFICIVEGITVFMQFLHPVIVNVYETLFALSFVDLVPLDDICLKQMCVYMEMKMHETNGKPIIMLS